ncbi:MAG: HAD family hydrolase [Candidatus Odinarchaeota archaeon]
MSSYEIISFDLFNTLVYVERKPFYDFKKSLEDIWRLVDSYSVDLSFDIFYNAYRSNYKAKQEELLAPTVNAHYKEQTLQQFIVDIFAQNNLGNSLELDELAFQMAMMYFRENLEDIYLYPEVKQLLATLKEKDYLLVLTSDHSWPPNGYDVLNKFDIGKFFENVVFSGEAGYRKPSPVIFEKAIEGIALSSRDNFLHVGDSYYSDVRGAIRLAGRLYG